MDPEIKVVAFDVDGTLYGKWSYLWRMTLSGFPDPLLAWAYNRARIRYREVQGTDPVLPETREGYLRRLSLLMLNALGRKPSEKAIARITRRKVTLDPPLLSAKKRSIYCSYSEKKILRLSFFR